MMPASPLLKAAFKMIFWSASMAVLLPTLAGRNLGQSEPAAPPAVNKQTSLLRLTIPGWTEIAPGNGMRFWHDPEGDVLALAVFPKEQAYPFTSSETEQRKWCRRSAEAHDAGLIEVRVIPSKIGP